MFAQSSVTLGQSGYWLKWMLRHFSYIYGLLSAIPFNMGWNTMHSWDDYSKKIEFHIQLHVLY